MFIFALPPRVANAVRIIGLVLIDWSVASSGHPPGASGRGLVVTILLVLASAAWLLWSVRARGDRDMADAGARGIQPELYVQAAAGGLLTAASPSSAASAFVFVAVVAAALRDELVRAAVVGAVGVCALAVGAILYSGSALGLLAYALGLSAAALAASNGRQSALRADQAELLLAQTQRSREEQLRTARLEESTRIARDIHDVLAHTLAGLAIQLEATAALLEQDADRSAILERVRRARQLAIEGLQETRRAVGALRSGPAGSLEPRLQALVEDYTSSLSATAELSISGDTSRLADPVAEAVVRITQEALTNVRKHAPGAPVVVTLAAGSEAADELALRIENRSAPAAAAPRRGEDLTTAGGGFGLQGMRERAAELGGEFQAGPSQSGWRVELRLPADAVAPAGIPAGAP